MERRWVVSGSGLITAGGDTPQEMYAAMSAGVTLPAVSEPSEGGPAHEFPTIPIPRFDPKHYLNRKGLKDISRTSLLAATAASRLTDHVAGVPVQEVGVCFGTAWGSLQTVVAFERAAHVDGPRLVDPLLFTETVANVPAGHVSIYFGWSAFNATLCSGSASAIESLRLAIGFLEEDRARIAVAGGGDELNLPLLSTLRAEGRTASDRESLPYGEGRSGPIGGEGACFLVVESKASARERNVLPLAWIDAHGGVFTGGETAAGRASRAALADLVRKTLDEAHLDPDEVDLIVLPGNGSVATDRDQALAVMDVFGSGATAPPAVAPKAIFGETWAAAGAIAVVVALEAMRTGTVPVRHRDFSLDPALAGLNLPRESQERAVRRALVLDASWEGGFSALVLSAGSSHGR